MKAKAAQETSHIPNKIIDKVEEEIGMKYTDNHRYYCIFYHDLVCPVQKKLKEFSLIDSLEPLGKDDNSVIAKAMKTVMTASTFTLQCLASFCSSCPHLRRRTHETAAMIRLYEMPSVGPAKPVCIPGRKARASASEAGINRDLQG